MKNIRYLIFAGICTIAMSMLPGCSKSSNTKEDSSSSTNTEPGSIVESRIGTLNFTHGFTKGYPTNETQKKLFDELGGLTFNTTTPYVVTFIDLNEGPWVIVMPEAEVRGAANDFLQIGAVQMTKPGKYLFVGPGQNVPENAEKDGYNIVNVPIKNLMPGLRLMSKDRDTRMVALESIYIYPYAERANPKPRGYITPDGKKWEAWQPRGMEYWERLHDIINREKVHECDRFYMAMLKSIGIEKGKPFNPDERLTKILTEGGLLDSRRLVEKTSGRIFLK